MNRCMNVWYIVNGKTTICTPCQQHVCDCIFYYFIILVFYSAFLFPLSLFFLLSFYLSVFVLLFCVNSFVLSFLCLIKEDVRTFIKPQYSDLDSCAFDTHTSQLFDICGLSSSSSPLPFSMIIIIASIGACLLVVIIIVISLVVWMVRKRKARRNEKERKYLIN